MTHTILKQKDGGSGLGNQSIPHLPRSYTATYCTTYSNYLGSPAREEEGETARKKEGKERNSEKEGERQKQREEQ